MKCFVCGEDKSPKKMFGKIIEKNVCKRCYPHLGYGGWFTPEKEIKSLIDFDSKGRPGPRDSKRFERHKG